MLKKQVLNKATKRIKKAESKQNSDNCNFWDIILTPFRWLWRCTCWCVEKLWQFICWLWDFICSINLIGLINLTLLITIIVLFTMLILDILNNNQKPVVIISNARDVQIISQNRNTKKSDENVVTLPLKANKQNVQIENDSVYQAHNKQTNENLYGDIIVENRHDAAVLKNGTRVHGNLYLQNMRKYVLPCDIKIDGNLFLRDINMLQFCGDFIITGNIYVSPRSSFGPIPKTAHLSGQIIL